MKLHYQVSNACSALITYPGAQSRLLSLSIIVLLACGACSNVRQAPVEDRQGADLVAPRPDGPDAGHAAATQAGEENYERWAELPRPDGSADPTETAASAETGTRVEIGQPSDNPAVIALLEDTELRLSQDDPEAAAGSLERALRLEPKNPWLWYRLAALKLRQGKPRLAIALAQKSNSLSARRPELRRANAELIERARKHQQGNQ